MKIRNITVGLLLLLGTLAGSQSALGQTANAPLAAALSTAQQQYNAAFKGHPQLYNGPEYIDYAKRYAKRTGHQFFLSPDRLPGSVDYNDHQFTELNLGYDVVLGQVVLQHATSPLTLRLINENVRSFTIGSQRFVRMTFDSTAANLLSTGYYEVLVDSSTQLIAKRAKRIQEKIDQGTVNVEFIPADRLFIRKAGVYYAVNKKRSVTKLFADRGKEVQKYIQDNKLKFKKARREADIVQLTRYYAGLAPQ
ncbi:hypothetical protein [Hymenobacter cavernae]|uniref:Uncharacterized protein n=1 Tax=Hymenobacter cavernae TaxID=2044852 RepID=A0ABQ1TWM8_9BACT|nr:hypothetical protein [Hymenobacter cavernae]GGF05584.1 hypothetical protein GCM10011383_15860 [Hymenobacter cavernae]